jgi:hypothetical protein
VSQPYCVLRTALLCSGSARGWTFLQGSDRPCSAIFKKYLQCVLAAKILIVYFVVCTLAVKKKNQGRFRHVGSDHSLVRSLSILQRPKQPPLKSMPSLSFMIQQLLEQFPPVHIHCRWCTKQDIKQCHFSYSFLLARHCFSCSTNYFRILLIVLSDTPAACTTLF